jgi:signal transduction histidine kinase
MTSEELLASGTAGTVGRLQVKVTTGPGYCGFDLPGVPRAVPAVRALLRRSLGDRATPELLICTTELATNAIEHTSSGCPGGRFQVTVQAEGETVLVSVLDEGIRTPQDRSAWGRPEEHGRGLGIVQALSIESGAKPVFAGRLAWFRIAVSDAAVGTPQRDANRDGRRDAHRDTTRDAALALAERRS